MSSSEFFSKIDPITYEGPESRNPLAYRYYDKDQMVMGKRMEDWLRPAVCYWHTFCWDGFDVFGGGTFNRPWHKLSGQEMAEAKLDVAFDFFTKLGTPYFCFHDIDIMAPAATIKEHTKNFAAILDKVEEKMGETGVKLLWGTANVFSHPRFMAGASTNPDPEVFAFAATQIRQAMDATKRLNGENYVMWGGREGYDTILNTDLGREMDQLGRMVSLAVDYKHKIGLTGPILIEPKPHEPTKHQYDRDTATVYGFLKRYGLENDVKVNIETNHATLAGNSMEHEVATAFALGIFGSIDANRGDPQNGWDTDQFWMENMEITKTMYHIVKNGGFETGGFNFDSKVRRQSIDAEDLFYGHISGLDALARGLLCAVDILEDGRMPDFVTERYAGWDGEFGQWLLKQGSLDEIADRAVKEGLDPKPKSGRQEYMEGLLNQFV
ncbi:xylose isomerase [Aquisalinus flavus]|uniref:Xylose isomerase n=1 Tax=Aquisalinus flavus TaxID=1526572 RepID=A0A8J2V4P5_9PROT|nr:xylose isomerase [Aquisalinus flavus]MBD0427162.1 xylose isomerase [Aquisalinus flavus]UNE46980.1 xylose isomerase [Aquisalinus flavus]GGC98852.1 xylose isomerase [Aquisalinus flavus]